MLSEDAETPSNDTRLSGTLLRIVRTRDKLWEWLRKQADPIQTLSVFVGFSVIIVGVVSDMASRSTREAEERRQSHYAAWQLINSASGQTSAGGRIDALQALNNDRVSLVDLQAPYANLTGIELPGATLSGSDLRSSTLTYADLNSSFILFTNLEGANLVAANLEATNFRSANLRNANLSGANLKNASLAYADMRGVILLNTNLEHADIAYADLRDVLFSEIPDPITGAVSYEDLKQALNWERAYYDGNTRQKLGLSPIPPLPTATPWDYGRARTSP